MNRIVKEHVPVEALPEDWREGLPVDALVRVEVSVEKEPSLDPAMTWDDIAALVPPEKRLTKAQADRIVREARDGWDENDA